MPPPEVFSGMPTLDELAEVVNRTDAIDQLASNSVSVDVLSMNNVPKLSASLAVDRPKNLRLRAKLPIMLGSGLDMGSNNELFWFQVPEGMSQTLYFARHDQFRQRPIRQVLPVGPQWVAEALGLVHLNPDEVVEGPMLRGDGKIELRTMLSMPDGLQSRVLIIEPTAGYVTDQMIYGNDGRLIAAASGTRHRYYEDQQCSLPHSVQIRMAPSVGEPLELRLEIGSYAVNQLLSSDPLQFAMPQDAARSFDLNQLDPPPQYTSAAPNTGAP